MMEGRKTKPLDLSHLAIDIDDSEIMPYDAEAIRNRVLGRINKLGFTLQPQPMKDGKPLLPFIDLGTIGKISNQDLSNKRGAYTNVFSYATEVRVLFDLMADAYEEQAKYVKDKIFLQARGNIDERKAVARTNPRYVQLNAKKLEFKAVSSLLWGKCSSYEAASAVLSRDVEFRRTDHAQHNRQHSVEHQRARRDRALRANNDSNEQKQKQGRDYSGQKG